MTLDRARWLVAFALRAAADLIEDLADHVDPRPWVGGGALPDLPPIVAYPGDEQRWRDDAADQAAPPFAADLVVEHPPHLAVDPTRPEVHRPHPETPGDTELGQWQCGDLLNTVD